ncbi:hypothetical protein RHO13_08070 [Orbus wheelerorum]|uniref:toxin VasX n=1 Tax=Orbus wheelerorum TaxID=3074111 RepID=UPI00370DA413
MKKNDTENANDVDAEFDNQLIFEESQKALTLESGKCSACERKGFPLFLVRKAIIPKEFKSEITWSAGMTAEKGSFGIDFKHSQYAYRTLREGYVYILAEKSTSKTLDVIAYEVTRSGAFRERPIRDIKGSRPKELPLTSCLAASHQLKAKFITIDNKRYQKIWVAYTFSRWSEETLDAYQQSEDKRTKRFTVIDLSQSKPEEMSPNNRSFALTNFIDKERHLLELECNAEQVFDYFDEQNDTNIASPEELSEKLKLDNSKGVYAKTDMKSLSTMNQDQLLSYFSDNFATAHHFNSLVSLQLEVNPVFNKTIIDYQNKGIQLAAIEVDDSFAVAEELAIQKRQLLSPIVNELLNYDQEKLKLVKQKYDILSDNFSKKQLLNNEKEAMKFEYSRFYKAFYSTNILDLDINQRYTTLDSSVSNSQQKKLLFAPQQYWITNNEPYHRAKLRAETIVEFFDEKKSEVSCYPLYYFKPEMSYARKQKSQIDAYQQMLLSIEEQATESHNLPCRVFAFYNSAERDYIDPVRNKEQLEHYLNLNYQTFYKAKYEDDKTTTTLDNLRLIEIVGLKELSQQLDIPFFPDSLSNSKTNGFTFKRLKYEGMLDYSGNSAPFGDYSIIEILPEEKREILNLYKEMKQGEHHFLEPSLNANSVDDVYVVEFTNAKAEAAKWKANKKWVDKQKRVFTSSIDSFNDINKVMFNSLMAYVKDVSHDYYAYCTWLFGDSYPFAFWRYECEPDLSDSHINYLYSLTIILDCNYMGNIELDEQDQFFAAFFRHKNTLYFHLLEGHQYSFFNVASGAIDDPELTEQVKNTLFNVPEPARKKITAPSIVRDIKWLKSNHKYITKLKLKNNVTVGAYLHGELVQITLSKATRQLTKGIDTIQKGIINENIIKSMNVFSPGIVRQYTIKVPVDKVAYVIQDVETNFSKLVGNNQTSSTHKMLNTNYKNNLSGKKYGNVKTFTKEVVEYKYYAHFDNHQQRAEYEKKLQYIAAGNKAGTDKVFICNATAAKEEDLMQAFKYSAELQRKSAIIDTTIAAVFSGVTVVSQYYQLAELKSRLKAVKSQAQYKKLQNDITKAHINMVVNFSQFLLHLSKYGAIYMAKVSLYQLANKYIGKLGKVSSIISLIDSLGTYANAAGVLKRGDEGSSIYYITSSIGLITVVAGIVGAISLPATILIGLCTFLISLLGNYDDGSTWDEIDKWLNRTMLGKFGRSDLLPPYPITDTGLYLSDQDFYLASQGGKLSLLSREVDYDMKLAEQEKLAPNMPKPIIQVAYPPKLPESKPIHFPRPMGESNDQGPYHDLYLTLNLPDFTDEISVFDGRIEISHRPSNSKTIFTFTEGSRRLNIKLFESTSRDYLKAEEKDGITRVYENIYGFLEEDSKKSDKIVKKDSDWLAMQNIIEPSLLAVPVTEQSLSISQPPETGLWMINQLLGRIQGAHYVSCYVNYWPQGRFDKNGQPNMPFLYAHEHNVNSMGESIGEYFGEVKDALIK